MSDDGRTRRPAAKPLVKPASQRQTREANPERIAAFGLGISAESRAAAWLIAYGYRILARRWKSPLGEIDIVAARRHLLIFVEVKARATLDARGGGGDASASSSASPRRRKSGSPRMPTRAFTTSASTPSWWRPASYRGISRGRLRREASCPGCVAA